MLNLYYNYAPHNWQKQLYIHPDIKVSGFEIKTFVKDKYTCTSNVYSNATT